jgi:hypothetical protein
MNEDINLAQQLRGRAAFIRKRGEIKNADIMESAAQALESMCRRATGPNGEACGLKPPCPDCGVPVLT